MSMVEGPIKEVPYGSNFQSDIKVYVGKTNLSGVAGILQLRDGIVTLVIDTEIDNEKTVLFSVPIGDVSKVYTTESVLLINVNDKKFKVEFGYMAGIEIGGGRGVAGGGVVSAHGRGKLRKSGYYWWLETFKQSGVRVSTWPLVYITIALVIIFVLAIIIFAPK